LNGGERRTENSARRRRTVTANGVEERRTAKESLGFVTFVLLSIFSLSLLQFCYAFYFFFCIFFFFKENNQTGGLRKPPVHRFFRFCPVPRGLNAYPI
jgi:hypothetical protein